MAGLAAQGLPLWPLALLAGLLPAVAALVSFALSVQLQLVPGCNPFVDGCTSISRAARYELPNHIFRALMLPAATLQGLVWLLAAHWLRGALGPRRSLQALATLGVVAAVALVLYATFLGTEGTVYRLLRQYGTVVYFGFTCLCMLLLGQAVQQLQGLAPQGGSALPGWLVRSHVALACTLVALGVVNAIVAARHRMVGRAHLRAVLLRAGPHVGTRRAAAAAAGRLRRQLHTGATMRACHGSLLHLHRRGGPR